MATIAELSLAAATPAIAAIIFFFAISRDTPYMPMSLIYFAITADIATPQLATPLRHWLRAFSWADSRYADTPAIGCRLPPSPLPPQSLLFIDYW